MVYPPIIPSRLKSFMMVCSRVETSRSHSNPILLLPGTLCSGLYSRVAKLLKILICAIQWTP
jgi:hypothetical protein